MDKVIETLTIDIETTGLPANGADYETQYDKFPRIVEFAYKINDEPVISHIINQEGFIIPENVIKIHGITNEKANASPHTLPQVLSSFLALCVNQKPLVIGHNIYFETSIIKANTIRVIKEGNLAAVAYDDMALLLDKDKRVDTVKKGMAITKKWPKLGELYYALFKKEFNRHHAADDCQATYECYVELKKRGLA